MAPCEFSEIPQNQEVNVHFSSAVQRRASARERRESPQIKHRTGSSFNPDRDADFYNKPLDVYGITVHTGIVKR
jgi:hypothetical protein